MSISTLFQLNLFYYYFYPSCKSLTLCLSRRDFKLIFFKSWFLGHIGFNHLNCRKYLCFTSLIFSQLDHATGNAHYFKRFEKPLYSFFLLFFFIHKSLPSNYKTDLTYKTLRALLGLKKGEHNTKLVESDARNVTNRLQQLKFYKNRIKKWLAERNLCAFFIPAKKKSNFPVA